jgi:hypothetical protein
VIIEQVRGAVGRIGNIASNDGIPCREPDVLGRVAQECRAQCGRLVWRQRRRKACLLLSCLRCLRHDGDGTASIMRHAFTSGASMVPERTAGLLVAAHTEAPFAGWLSDVST